MATVLTMDTVRQVNLRATLAAGKRKLKIDKVNTAACFGIFRVSTTNDYGRPDGVYEIDGGPRFERGITRKFTVRKLEPEKQEYTCTIGEQPSCTCEGARRAFRCRHIDMITALRGREIL